MQNGRWRGVPRGLSKELPSVIAGVAVAADSPTTSIDGPSNDALSERIAPPEGKSYAEIRAEIEATVMPPAGSACERQAVIVSSAEAMRFSLGEMLAVVTIVSVGMAGVRWLPPPIYTGIVGFVMFGLLIVLSFWNVEARLAKLIWWSLLTVYLLSLILSFVTVFNGT